jgi:peptide/nickel transport system ATP-binding protein
VPHLRDDSVLVGVEDLTVEFPADRGRVVHAVSNVTFDLKVTETLGLVGESGSGKSSTARSIACLPKPTGGRVIFDGVEITGLEDQRLRQLRPQFQMIFQNPMASLNPRRRVGDIVAEPLRIWPRKGVEPNERAGEVLESVGLDRTIRDRFPHELSGGQGQRVAIARAVVLDPKLLICDEPVSALDMSVQAQILNLLEDLKRRYDLTMIFVSHDLAVVRNITDRVIIMYLGKLCEVGGTDEVYARPAHPYTCALLQAIPQIGVARPGSGDDLAGELPSPIDPPTGCRFRTRCPNADAQCAQQEPVMRRVGPGHWVACHHPNVPALEAREAVD